MGRRLLGQSRGVEWPGGGVREGGGRKRFCTQEAGSKGPRCLGEGFWALCGAGPCPTHAAAPSAAFAAPAPPQGILAAAAAAATGPVSPSPPSCSGNAKYEQRQRLGWNRFADYSAEGLKSHSPQLSSAQLFWTLLPPTPKDLHPPNKAQPPQVPHWPPRQPAAKPAEGSGGGGGWPFLPTPSANSPVPAHRGL